MKISQKIIIFILFVLIIPILLSIFYTRNEIKLSLEKIEVENIKNVIQSVKKFLDIQAEAHDSAHGAVSEWNEYFDCVAAKDYKSIIDEGMIACKPNSNFEFCITVSKEGQILASRSFIDKEDLKEYYSTTIPKEFQQPNISNFDIFKRVYTSKLPSEYGLYQISNKLYFITIVKLVKSGDTKYSVYNGFTLYGREVKPDNQIKKCEEMLQTKIAFKLSNGTIIKNSSTMFNIVDNKLTDDSIHTFSKYQDNLFCVQAHQVLKDADGKIIGTIIIEKSSSAATQADNKLLINMLLLIVITLVGSALFLYIIVYYVVRIIKDISRFMKNASDGKGDLTKRVLVKSKDELGSLAKYFNLFIEKICEIIKEINKNVEILNNSTSVFLDISNNLVAHNEQMNASTEEMTSTIRVISDNIASNSSELIVASSSITEIAKSVEQITENISNLVVCSNKASESVTSIKKNVSDVSVNINQVSTSAVDVSNSVITSSNAIQDINNSITQISSNCERALEITIDASEKAKSTNAIINKLFESSKKINKITEFINKLATQTNMLSLNAAIEAVGAGEAGKGFVVVSNEIKELAKQTSEATIQISTMIKEMQESVKAAVDSVDIINRVIVEITDISTMINTSVKNQTDTTSKLSNDMYIVTNKANIIDREIVKIALSSEEILENVHLLGSTINQLNSETLEIHESVKLISEKSESSSIKINQVSAKSHNISNASTEIAINISEINNASQITVDSTVQIAEKADVLDSNAKLINELVKQFKIE